jgi:single-stranded DNA-specific DHH superfamily exonuclease
MKTINQLKQEFNDFIDLSKIKNILVIADDDEDGYTSALQLRQFLEDKGLVVKTIFNDKSDIGKQKFSTKINGFEYELIVFLDLNEEIIGMYNKILSKDIPIVDIDHHPSPSENLISNPLLVLKPQAYSDQKPSQHSTTRVVYDLFGGDDLLASIGIIGDSAYPQWKNFIDETAAKYSTDFETLAGIGDMIKCIANLHKNLMYELFDFIYENLEINKLKESKFYDLKKEFDVVVKNETERFRKESEKIDEFDITFFRTIPKYTSKMSNVLSKLIKGTLVIYSGDDKQIKGSVRRPDFKIHSGDLIKFAIANDASAQGGGHIPAGGFCCDAKYFSTFKERAIEFMKINHKK